MLTSCLRVYNFLRHCLIAILGLIGMIIQLQAQDIKKVDSLKERMLQLSSFEKLEILNELFKEYNQVDYTIALSYATEFDDLARQLGDSVKIVEGGRKIAYSLMDIGKNEEAIEILTKILGIAERNQTQFPEVKKQIKFILNNAGLAYDYLGNYDKALEYHYMSLSTREEEGDKKSIGTALNNLGLVFYHLKDVKKAIEYYQRAIDTKREIGDNNDLDRIIINLGLCYNHIGEFGMAISQFDLGFSICKEDCSDNMKREGLLGLGIAHLGNGNLENAEDCLLKSLQISKKQTNALYQIDNLHQLSLVESARENDEKALKYLNEALALAESSDFVDPLIKLYDQFAKVYSRENNYEKTAYYLGKYTTLKDSIFSEELMKNFTKVQTNYAERENIKTIKEKDEILLLKQQLIDRQRAQYFYIVLVAILTLGFAVVLLFDSRRQRKSRTEIGLAKEKIEEQNKLLEEQNKALDHRVKNRTMELSKSNLLLSEVNAELDNFLYKTSHDIRGPIATMQGLCNLGLIDSKDPVVTNVLNQMVSQSDRMSKIVGRLTTISDINHTILRPEKIDFLALLDWILANEEEKARSKNIQISFEVAEGLQIISDELMIRTILENLVNNGIKFYNDSVRLDSFVKVQVSQNDSIVNIRVIDNGIGIGADEAKADGMFHIFTRASERSETGGVGLYLSKLCSQKIGGQIRIEKSDDDGTIFLIQLPVDLAAVLEKRRLLQEDMQRILEEENTQKAKLVSFT